MAYLSFYWNPKLKNRFRIVIITFLVLGFILYPVWMSIISKEWFLFELRINSKFSNNNCGHIKIKEDPSQAVDCTNRLLAADKPFWVAFDRLGYDTQVAIGISHRGDGLTAIFTYDSNIGMHCPFCIPRIERRVCENASLSVRQFKEGIPIWSIDIECESEPQMITLR